MAMSTRRRQPADHEIRKEHLELVTPSPNLLTAGDLPYEGAWIPDGHEQMLLLDTDREAFLEAMMNPPEPTEKLLTALKSYREVVG